MQHDDTLCSVVLCGRRESGCEHGQKTESCDRDDFALTSEGNTKSVIGLGSGETATGGRAVVVVAADERTRRRQNMCVSALPPNVG